MTAAVLSYFVKINNKNAVRGGLFVVSIYHRLPPYGSFQLLPFFDTFPRMIGLERGGGELRHGAMGGGGSLGASVHIPLTCLDPP